MVDNQNNDITPNDNELYHLYPTFSKATSILLNTGNIVSSKRIKKKTNNLQANDEIVECMQAIIHTWLPTVNRSEIQEQSSVICRHPEFYERLEESERDEVSISIKLFLNKYDPVVLEAGLNSILEELNLKYIDTLILSFPNSFYDKNDLQKEQLQPLWSVIEKNLENKTLLSAGVSDFNKIYLEQFCKLIDNKQHLPTLNQVNLSSCCKMPEDLIEFAKANNIQLTTHNDLFELKDDIVKETLLTTSHEYDAYGWAPLWLARYTYILKGRGIVKAKGYLLQAKRELKYTKV